MRKILFILSGWILLFLPKTALAWIEPSEPSDISANWKDKILEGGTNAMWSIFVAVGVVMFLYAGFIFLTSEGDPGKMTKAKNAFLYGVIGVIVGVLGWTMVNIIKKIFF